MVLFLRADRAGHEFRLEPVGIEPALQSHDLLRGTAHVHAGYEPQHLDATHGADMLVVWARSSHAWNMRTVHSLVSWSRWPH